MQTTAAAVTPLPRRRDSDATRRAILDAAFVEFSDHGLSGARVDAITARTGVNVRMIYYYFHSKLGLYTAVLEEAYGTMRTAERALRLETLDPVAGIEALCGFTFDYQEANPRFVRLVSIENIQLAEQIEQSAAIRGLNRTILTTLDGILKHGIELGLFRPDATAWNVHLLMTSFCFFRVANHHTLKAIFSKDALAAKTRKHQRRMVMDAVLGYLRPA